MTYIEETEQCKKIEERASLDLKNEMELYFDLHDEWKDICKNAELEVEHIIITRKKDSINAKLSILIFLY